MGLQYVEILHQSMEHSTSAPLAAAGIPQFEGI